MQSKRCPGCGVVKPSQSYSKARNKKSGLQSRCKKCNRAYREANREEANERQRARYASRREQYAAAGRAYREANREEIRSRKRSYHAEHKEEVNKTASLHAHRRAMTAREVAVRSGEPWTTAEDRIVLTSNGTLLDIAIDLGRTVGGVQSRRVSLHRMGVTA